MDKILLIVDPQVDFISGSLAVEGAKEKMDALASALQNGEIDCDYVMVTKDFHPSNHCSFKENGGQWPPHCVKGTAGSCVYAPLWSVINNYAYRKDTDIFIKGDSPDKEEYSIFDNLESLSVISDILLDFESDPDNEIRVVGIAGFILKTDYRTCLPYFVKWDDGSTSRVIGCTITTETPEDSIIEESEEDVETALISGNGLFREVTFYERN